MLQCKVLGLFSSWIQILLHKRGFSGFSLGEQCVIRPLRKIPASLGHLLVLDFEQGLCRPVLAPSIALFCRAVLLHDLHFAWLRLNYSTPKVRVYIKLKLL